MSTDKVKEIRLISGIGAHNDELCVIWRVELHDGRHRQGLALDLDEASDEITHFVEFES